MAAINLDIGGNTRRLDRDIQKTVNRVYNINLKTKGDQPLGRITGQVNEFNKSLDASNARVIAFGASAGIIFGVQRAFTALVGATIEVQKSLQDINVILNVSAQNLQKFGGELFSIAKNTGQSFQEVAKAATEFSRQGLGVEETLKRTNEALILSRLSGLDAAKSVEALTAAVNSYASQAVTATEVVNKFATVDAAFAVSSADLAEALARVGSSAAQSGVSLNELIAIVTSAQQTTARGGAVIGNSFKTIFTRLQRGKVVDLLGTLGISDTDSSGQLKSTIQLLQDLGKVYDTLGARQQAAVAEQVGGVFQINILKAALADLGKEYSIYSGALNVAAGATDQAIRRNEELNKTYAAQLNALQENARQIASAAGERLIGPSIDRLVGGSNIILGGINESDGQGVGAVLGKGIVDGLGQFIAGPGLALIGGVLLKLFRDLAKFATGSVQQLLGLNTAATQQKDLQASISQILAKNPQLLELALKGEQGLNTAANSLLASLQKQTVELQKQAAVAAQLSKAFVSQAGVRVAGGIPVAPPRKPGKAAGYIPNFAEVSQAIELGAPSSVQSVSGVGKIGGKSFEANNKEFQIPDFGGTGETAVIPKYGGGIKEATKMIARGESGSVLDKSDRNRAKGFVPNFAKNRRDYKVTDGDSTINFSDKKQGRLEFVDAIESWQKYGLQAKQEAEKIIYSKFPNTEFLLKSSDGKAAYNRYSFRSNELQNTLIKKGLGVPDIRYSGQNYIASTLQTMQKNIGLWSDKNKDGFYNHPKAQQFIKQNNLEKKLSSQTDLSKNKKNFILGSATRFATGRFGGKLLPETYKSGKQVNFQELFASGFIPNFAQTKKAIDLGNLDKIPNELGNKVVSLIYPGLSDGYTLSPATASYLKQEYRGNIPVAGINQTKLKSQIPDLDKNLGDLLVKEANQFGQSLGGSNFLKSAEDLPNYGAAKGAVGVAFEGGVQTLLQQKVGRKQNAGIDFRNITPRLRSIFNNAPGMYDAKSSPALTNEVFKKLLNETKPGATVKKTSGQAGKDYAAKRSAAVNQLRQEGVTGSVAIRQALRDRFGIVGKAAGYIPNFAAIQDAVSRERAAGIPSNQIYLAQEQALTSANPMGIGVFNKRDEPTAGKRRKQMKRKGFARGYIPNFAIEDPDTQASDFGTAATAITAGLTTLAFAFSLNGDQYKESLKELTQANLKRAKEELKQSRLEARRLEQRGLGNFATTAREDASKRFREQSTPGIITKGKAFGGANALGLSIAAPIIGETIKNIAGQETPTQRGIGATGAALGQIGSFAATGGLVGGAPGAAIGGAIGALLIIPTVINTFTSEMPELAAAAKKASQDLTKFSDVSQRLLTASSSLSEFTDKQASPEKLKKVQDDFAKALAELTPAERARIESSIKVGNLEEELARITQERIDQEKLRTQAASIRGIEERKGALGLFAAGFDPNTAQGRIDEETIRSAFKGFFTGKTPEETLANLNKASQSGLPQLQELIKSAGTLTKATQVRSSGSLKQFRGILEGIIPQGNTADEQDFRSRFIKDLVDIADEGDIKALQNVLQIPIKSLTRDRQQLEEGIKSAERATESTAIFNKVKEKYSGIIDNSISSLNRTISVFNSLASALDQFQVSAQNFAREQSVAQGFTLPKNVAETVLGPEAELTRRAALFEKIAQNENARLDAIDKSNLGFREDFRQNLNEVFSERLTELQTLKGSEARTIPEQSALAEEILRAQKVFESGAVNLNDILEGSFKDGAIDSDKFETNLRAAFEKADFKSSETEKILDGILKVSEQQNANLLSINQNAKQQNIRAAQEFTNEKILLDINRSLKVFGGTQGFLQPPEEGIVKPLQTLIQSATGQLKAQRGFEFAKRTGAGTSFGTDAQVQNNIGLGQSSLNFINQLKEISGGAFAPDPGSELYNRAVAGLTQSFENNIKKLNDVLKDPNVDQAFKSQIKATLDAIGGLGSGREISQLQVAQETGSAFQSTLEGTLSRLQDPAIQQLRDAKLPDLANEIARSAQYTSNPIVNALNVQKSIQTNITKQLEDIKKLIPKPQPKTNQDASIVVDPSKGDVQTNAKGFIPAFNKERKAIGRGVGGARSVDRPQFIPNLNGIPAFVNSGERLVDNFGGSGQTAVLTREMQNAMTAARGFIPNFANGQPIITADSFGPISGEVIQDLTDTGKDYIVIRSNKYLDDSFRNETISFGQGKGIGKIISIDSVNPYLARVKPTQTKGVLPPVKGFKFDGKFLDQPKEDLSKEDLDKKIDRYLKQYKEAESFTITGNSKGTPADAADMLKNLQREFQFNSKKYKDIDNNGLYRSIKDSVEALRNKIRSRNSVTEEGSQDPEFLRFLEDQKNKPRGIGPATAIQDQITEAVAGSATGDAVAKATAVNPEDLYTDAFLRAAQVTAKLGEYTNLNLGSNNAFGRANERPKIKLEPGKGGADAGPFVSGLSEFVEFYSKNPGIDTFFNEATHVNQNLVPGKDALGELNAAQQTIENNGGTQAYLQRLKKFADFIEQQNRTAQQPFVKISNVGPLPIDQELRAASDQRRFDTSPQGFVRKGSEEKFSSLDNSAQQTRYIQERASSLNDALSMGIVSGNITAQELGLLGIPLDISESIVAETLAIDKQLKKQQLPKEESDIPKATRGTPEEIEKERRRLQNERIDKGIEESRRKLREGEKLLNPTPSGPPAVPGIPPAAATVPPPQPGKPKPKPGKPTSPSGPPVVPGAGVDSIDRRIEESRRKLEEGRKLLGETPSTRIIGGQGNRPATQINASGTGVPVPKGGRVNYPGGISPETARAIVQELDATYDQAIRNSKSPGQAKSWAQTQQRYRLFYSRGQYAELDRFYKQLAKGSDYNNNYGQGTGRRGESVQNLASGFIPNFSRLGMSHRDPLGRPGVTWGGLSSNSGSNLGRPHRDPLGRPGVTWGGLSSNSGSNLGRPHRDPLGRKNKGIGRSLRDIASQIESTSNYSSGYIPNFAQDYISNLANLESGLSGEKAQLTNIPGIGLAMINGDQTPGKFPAKDHPEGKMAAIRNSMKMQKSMGVMNKGYIPNFAATDQSFAQQEAAFNTNTSALTSLAGGIESLNSTLSNFEANFANLNNTPGTQTVAGAQPNVQTTTNAPVNVIVNAESDVDIATAVGEAVKKAIPSIIDQVRRATGEKIPPKVGG